MNRFLNLLVIVISIATFISGATQIVAPGFVLTFIGADVTPATSHFFAIIGMFMALFGGLMLHAVYSAGNNRIAVLWAAFQKLGAAIAVGVGIMHGIFSILALGVALFDLFSAIVFFYYLKTLRSGEAA